MTEYVYQVKSGNNRLCYFFFDTGCYMWYFGLGSCRSEEPSFRIYGCYDNVLTLGKTVAKNFIAENHTHPYRIVKEDRPYLLRSTPRSVNERIMKQCNYEFKPGFLTNRWIDAHNRDIKRAEEKYGITLEKIPYETHYSDID